MADSFNQREQGFEAKFKMDKEMEFKVDARRNKLLGLWLAEKLGLPEAQYADYAKEVVIADLDEPGHEDVMRKVMKDIADKGANVTEDEVRSKIEELLPVAHAQISSENS